MELTGNMAIGYSYRLYKCSSDVLRPRYGNQFLILRSYSTRVGIADFNTKTFYLFDYYSKTSIQHAYKFQKHLQETYHEHFNIVKLWLHSQLTASEKRQLEQEDYSSLIQLS